MPDRLPLVLYDGDRMVAEIALGERPANGAEIPAPLRQIDPVKTYDAAVTTADGKTWRYRAKVVDVAGNNAILKLRMASVSGVPRYPPKKQQPRR